MAEKNKRYVGTVECEELGRQLESAILAWRFDNKAYTALTDLLREGHRYRFTNIVDATDPRYEDIELTADSEIEELGPSRSPTQPIDD